MIFQVVVTATMIALSVVGAKAHADTKTAQQNLSKNYPNTTFSGLKETPLKGVYQVIMGKNIAYTDEAGRYFIFGSLFDMKTQTDLTAQDKAEVDKVKFSDLPLKNAIKIQKGTGKHTFALFTDPDCPYCKRLEATLASMTDFTVYVFPYPITSLHPDAAAKAEAIWCSKDKQKAWLDYMLKGSEPAKSRCANPIDENIALANKLGIRGTPTMIRSDGKKISGALPKAQLEQWLKG